MSDKLKTNLLISGVIAVLIPVFIGCFYLAKHDITYTKQHRQSSKMYKEAVQAWRNSPDNMAKPQFRCYDLNTPTNAVLPQ